MEGEPVAVVRAIYRTIESADPGLFDLLDADIHWVTPVTLPWGLPEAQGRYSGHERLLAYFRNAAREVDGLRVDVDDLLPCGERVLALGRESGTSRATRRSFTARCAHLWTIKDGKATRLEGYPDTAAMWSAFDR